ncbi:MAG TPA: phosphatase PAP2 family protein [Actinomycetes bacterium]|nr:phosphatase PAP2 family protein [Actinomycetes bacterium]
MVREPGSLSGEANVSAEVNGSPGLGSVRVALASLSLLVVAVPFALLLVLVEGRWAPLLRIDVATDDALHAFAVDHDTFVNLMRLLSWSGSTTVWFVVYGAIAATLLVRGRLRLATFVVVTIAGSSLLNSFAKSAVDRARPALADPVARADGWSFPSGHAQAAIVGYTVLVLLLVWVSPWPAIARWRWLIGVAAAVMILAIGFSRIALGVHYLSDVLGGYLLGAAWMLALVSAFGVLSRGRRARRVRGRRGWGVGRR